MKDTTDGQLQLQAQLQAIAFAERQVAEARDRWQRVAAGDRHDSAQRAVDRAVKELADLRTGLAWLVAQAVRS